MLVCVVLIMNSIKFLYEARTEDKRQFMQIIDSISCWASPLFIFSTDKKAAGV